MEGKAGMTKRQRRTLEAHKAEQAERMTMRRRAVLIAGLAVIVLALVGGVMAVLRSAWVAAHNGQIVGVLGLIVLAVLCALPIAIEFQKHPRHLSGPGHNPEQGPGPWNVGD